MEWSLECEVDFVSFGEDGGLERRSGDGWRWVESWRLFWGERRREDEDRLRIQRPKRHPHGFQAD